MATMKALQLLQPELKLEVRDVPRPVLTRPTDVLVRVAYAGICGTDLHALQRQWAVSQDWITLGHELSGVVAATGSDVTTCNVGDRVVVDPHCECAACSPCRRGQVHFCKLGGVFSALGFFRDGGWAELTVVSQQSVYLLPPTLPLRSAALCEPLSCLIHALDRFPVVPAHGGVVILGAGIIGVLTACILHHRGARRVTVSEPSAARRAFVDGLNLGFSTVTPTQLAEQYGQLTDAELAVDGLQMVIDCSGCCPAIEQAAGWLRMGGALCLFGIAPPAGRVSLSPYLLVSREISVLGSKINPHTFERATLLAADLFPRYLQLEALGVEVFPLERYQEAVAKLKAGEISKAMFEMDGALDNL